MFWIMRGFSQGVTIIPILIMCLSISIANERLAEVKRRVSGSLSNRLIEKGVKLGDQAFLRAFKQNEELEVWIKPAGQEKFVLYKTYPIAGSSGGLGPKLAEGDRQMPEGFYHITKGALNPNSSYHLSFNIGYPNSYDRSHKRTGSFIMVHGSNVSVGCYAMTDPAIEEIYLIVEAALKAGQKSVPFYSYPFRFERGWEKVAKRNPRWGQFWTEELYPVYRSFQQNHIPALVYQSERKYSFH